MKKIVFILLVIIGINSTYAKCGMGGMQFFPEKRNISLNSIFIIEGYLTSGLTINSFKKRAVYLKSENGELIKLNVVEILESQKYLMQAIFKPEKRLKPNTTYFLEYSEQTENETRDMIQRNPITKLNEKVHWKTTDEKFIPLLNPNLAIKFKKTEVVHYGCGPSVNAIFDTNNKSDSEIWYKTELFNITTNEQTVYYIKSDNQQIYVGHDMCSGAFTFNKNEKYKVRFTPMNIDGKLSNTTDWQIFENPYLNDKKEY